MVQKNKGKGGKRHRRGKKGNDVQASTATKMTEGKYEKYGKIINLAGDCRVRVITPLNKEYVCHIPGKFRKRVWMKMDDIVLFAIRPFEQDKGDIISVYTSNEARWLTMKKEIPSTFSNIELNDSTSGGQDIIWNRGSDDEDDSFENNSDIADEAKEARRAEKALRDSVPAQSNIYGMPSSSESDSEDEPINNTNMKSILDEL
jgi:translation initiation factor 1A